MQITKNINGLIAIYEYDLDGNMILEKNEYGYTHKYTYDEFGNKT